MGIRASLPDCMYLSMVGCRRSEGIYYSELGRSVIKKYKCCGSSCTVQAPYDPDNIPSDAALSVHLRKLNETLLKIQAKANEMT